MIIENKIYNENYIICIRIAKKIKEDLNKDLKNLKKMI